MFSERTPSARYQCLTSCSWTPPTKLILTAKDPPRATLGLGRAGWPQQHQLAPSACSTELLAGGTGCFSMSCTGGTQQLCTPLEQPSHSRRRHSTASPLMWAGGHIFPHLSMPQCLYGLWKHGGRIPQIQTGTDSSRARGGSWLWVCDMGWQRAMPAPPPCCTSLQGWPRAVSQ